MIALLTAMKYEQPTTLMSQDEVGIDKIKPIQYNILSHWKFH